ncbi:MAG: ATP-binding protein [Myxococcota bacterium]|nr:ATP-binding protein [Myxococcota bacterium]
MKSQAVPVDASTDENALSPEACAQILDAQPTALLVAAATGEVRYANRRAGEILDVPGDELLGRRIDDVLAPLDELRDIVAEAEQDDLRASIAVGAGVGASRELGIQLAALPPGVVGDGATAVVFQDIDHYQQLRRDRDRLLKLATVGEVLPSILHELKNPLASVTNAVELLVEEAAPGPLRDELHAILTEVRRMCLGFDGIGVVSRDLVSTSYNAIDLALRQTAQILKARAQQDGVTLRCEVPDLPLLALDPSVVRAIAFNLLTNALHACSPGGEVQVASRLEEGGRVFAFEVCDGGSGMDPDTLRCCTELFFTTKKSGSGIGLALCKGTLEAAGGSLEISSELGSGTTARVRVPLPSAEDVQGTRREV